MRGRPALLSGLVAGTLVALTAGAAAGVETPYRLSGKTNRNGSSTIRSVRCAKGAYIRNSGKNSGTISDAPFINRAGTARGVGIASRATSSIGSGRFANRLATGIEIWVQNYNPRAHRSLKYRIALRCTTRRASAWVIVATVRGGPVLKTESSKTVSGFTASNNNAVSQKISCESGRYIKNNGYKPGTIFDEPSIDTSGTAKGAGVSGHQTTSVAWGHAFSRLATGIEISAQNDNNHRFQSLAYRATVKCTDSQDDAWVVFG